MAPLSLFSLAFYYLISRKCATTNRMPSASKSVVYTKLQNSDTEYTEEEPTNDQLTTKEKISAIMTLFAYVAVPLFTAFFSEYIILQSVITTLAYKSAPFRPRDHYMYYFIMFWLGELITRSHRTVISCINSQWLYKITQKGLWGLALVEILHMFFLLFESWYRFLPGVEIVLCVCFTAGLTVGLLFNNALEFFVRRLEIKQRKFGLGLYLFPLAIGVLVAGLVGLSLETQLREHCMATVTDNAYCFTRSASIEDISLRCGRKSL